MTAERGGAGPDGASETGQPGRVRVRFTPAEREVRVPPGVSVFDAASWHGIAIDSTCGGHGTCKKCKVQVVDGSVPVSRLDVRAFSGDQLKSGWRLACLAQATNDLRVDVPPLQTRPKAATVGVGRQVILRPAIQKRHVELAEPSLADQTPDLERLLAAIDDLELRVDLHALRRLPTVLRDSDYRLTAVIVDNVLVDVEPGDTTARRFGIAYDLGTTTVVATLLDTATGTPVAVRSMLNRQQPYGGDVITRISATMLDSDALGRLQALAHDTLDQLTREVCKEAGVEPSEVYEVALAGNATMVHLALGIDPEPLGVAPFVMAAREFPELMASDLGIQAHPRARAMLFGSLGAYVGGDIVAGMLASGMDRDKRLRLFIDVGTNCEIVLGDGERILATAAPAGPAFEGAAIRCGMRAAEGAIETVRIVDGELALQVIGDVDPAGLCGSGLVDAVAAMLDAGLLDSTGRFVPAEQARQVAPRLADRFTEVAGERVFVLSWGAAGSPDSPVNPADRVDQGVGARVAGGSGHQPLDQHARAEALDHAVYLSQRDVRELQFAKAAISTGWSLLLSEMGVTPKDVQQVLLAGSFGSYLSASSAVRIGLVPKLPVLRIVSAGNVAGEGAKMAILSVRERAGAAALLEEVRYVELSDRDDFNDRFVDNLGFSS